MRTLYYDVSDTLFARNSTGIQRVVKETLRALDAGQSQFRLVPVVAYRGRFYSLKIPNSMIYRQAQSGTAQRSSDLKSTLLKNAKDIVRRHKYSEFLAKRYWVWRQKQRNIKPILGRPVAPKPNDLLYLSDYLFGYADVVAAISWFRRYSTNIVSLVYDMIPVTHPQYFHGDEFPRRFKEEIVTINEISSHIVTISNASKAEYKKHIGQSAKPIAVCLLAAEVPEPVSETEKVPAIPEGGDFFLSVGTVEPRKGYLTTLRAFEAYWASGGRTGFVIVGKDGWSNSEIIAEIKRLQSADFPLIWHSSASDTDLRLLYNQSKGVICASEAEGFGLPLLEAQLYRKHVIASDIPVFKEIGNNNVTFFKVGSVGNLTAKLLKFSEGEFYNVEIKDWNQYAKEIIEILAHE